MGINHRKNGLQDPTLTASERALRSLTPEDREMLAALPEPSLPRDDDSGSLARALVAVQAERDFLRREILSLCREIAALHASRR